MINTLIRKAVYNPGLTLVCTLIAAIAGGWAFQHLPIDAVPDITNVQVQVNTPVQGLVPEEIERFITFPIESSMSGLPRVQEVRSISRFGLSQVTIIFTEGTDIYRARQLVAERLQDVREKIPATYQPSLGPITTGLGEVYFYQVEAKDIATDPDARMRQLMELRALQEWSIVPRLLTVPGVTEVNTIGGYAKQYHVQPDLKALAQYGIHLDDLVEAITHNNRNTGGGYIQQTAEQLLIQATGIVQSIADIRAIPVTQLPSLHTITVGDIAQVGLASELRTGAALVNGQETVMGTALMTLGENSRAVAERVHAQIHDIQQSLPKDVTIRTLYNRSDLVNATLSTVQHNLLYGAGLVIVVLLLLIGNVRVAIITAITIPLSLLTTFIAMRSLGISGNLMSLGALDFGIIIDGAVIVMDNCVRHLRARSSSQTTPLSRADIRETVVTATTEIRQAAGFGQLIIVLVFLPLLALTGVEGKMFVPMAATFGCALMAAFVLSFTTIPALAGWFLPGTFSTTQPWLLRHIERLYRPTIRWTLAHRRAVIGGGAVAIVVGVVLFRLLGAEFLPRLDEGSIAMQFVRPTNISIDQSVAMQSLSEQVIHEFPEVETVLSRLGTAEIATDPMGVNLSDTYILLKARDHWPEVDSAPHTKNSLIAAMKAALAQRIPGQRIIVSQPIELRFNELLEGVRADVAVKFFGEDMDVLTDVASEAAAILRTIPGVGEAESEVQGTAPVLRVRPNMQVLHRLGVDKEEILTTIETAIGGTEAGNLFAGVQRFPIVVRLAETDRANLDAIRDVPVGITQSLTMPLHQVAHLDMAQTHSDIRREASKKRVAVLLNVRDRDVASFVADAQERIATNIILPAGTYMEWGGSFQNLAQAKSRLAIVVPMALLCVFVMIYLAFRSAVHTCLIFVCVPMALIGGVLALILTGQNFSISAAVGFIALSGIATLNGIVLVSYFNQLRAEGKHGDELICQGTHLRLRPVMMTALTDIFGFLPMMFSTGMGAEVQRPLATVVVGGIVSATLLTLVVLPVLYRVLEDKMPKEAGNVTH